MPRCGQCAHETRAKKVAFEGDTFISHPHCVAVFEAHGDTIHCKPDTECPHPECFELKQRKVEAESIFTDFTPCPFRFPPSNENAKAKPEIKASMVVVSAKAMVMAMDEKDDERTISAAFDLLLDTEVLLRSFPDDKVARMYIQAVERHALDGDFD